jgi:phosphoglycerol transferase MdoB-like AlkP superfamily enzyme
MYNGMLHLHNFLRWIIIILLLINIVKAFSGNKSLKLSLYLLISSHITLLIGLYQYFTGANGFAFFKNFPVSEIMKNNVLRFWAIEHIFGMLIGITLITIGHISLKKSDKTKKTAILYLIAFIIIMVTIPWPFRHYEVGRSLFPGM